MAFFSPSHVFFNSLSLALSIPKLFLLSLTPPTTCDCGRTIEAIMELNMPGKTEWNTYAHMFGGVGGVSPSSLLEWSVVETLFRHIAAVWQDPDIRRMILSFTLQHWCCDRVRLRFTLCVHSTYFYPVQVMDDIMHADFMTCNLVKHWRWSISQDCYRWDVSLAASRPQIRWNPLFIDCAQFASLKSLILNRWIHMQSYTSCLFLWMHMWYVGLLTVNRSMFQRF